MLIFASFQIVLRMERDSMLDSSSPQHEYLAANFMKKNDRDVILQFLRRAGSKGGKARAAKYDREVLKKWGKAGGRPKAVKPKEHSK
jgi:hypothetical protein